MLSSRWHVVQDGKSKKEKKHGQLHEDTKMDELIDYDIQLSKQERWLLVKTPRFAGLTPQQFVSPLLTPNTKDRKKNLDLVFGWHSCPYVVSQFCNILKQKLPKGRNTQASMQAIMATIHAMLKEGHLLEEKNMEDVSSKQKIIKATKGIYT